MASATPTDFNRPRRCYQSHNKKSSARRNRGALLKTSAATLYDFRLSSPTTLHRRRKTFYRRFLCRPSFLRVSTKPSYRFARIDRPEWQSMHRAANKFIHSVVRLTRFTSPSSLIRRSVRLRSSRMSSRLRRSKREIRR